MRKLRVVQWATDNVGKHAIAAVHEDPELELVGALVYGGDKAGLGRPTTVLERTWPVGNLVALKILAHKMRNPHLVASAPWRPLLGMSGPTSLPIEFDRQTRTKIHT